MPTTEEQLDDLRQQLEQLRLTTRKNVPAIPLPKFKGRDDTRPFATFLDEFNAVALAMDWNDTVKCQMFPAALESEANAIYHTLTNATRNDWKQLLTELGQRLASSSDNNYHRQQLQSRTQKDGESISEYGRAIRFLVRRSFPDSDGISDVVRKKFEVDYFLGGLKPNVKEQLMRRNRPDSLETAIIEAQKEETLQRDIRRDYETRSLAINAICLAEKQRELQEQVDEIKRSVAQPRNKVAFVQKNARETTSATRTVGMVTENPTGHTTGTIVTSHYATIDHTDVGIPEALQETIHAHDFSALHLCFTTDRAISTEAGPKAHHRGATAVTMAGRNPMTVATDHLCTRRTILADTTTMTRFVPVTTLTPFAISTASTRDEIRVSTFALSTNMTIMRNGLWINTFVVDYDTQLTPNETPMSMTQRKIFDEHNFTQAGDDLDSTQVLEEHDSTQVLDEHDSTQVLDEHDSTQVLDEPGSTQVRGSREELEPVSEHVKPSKNQ
ncbi:hypothetical protein AAVH_22836 [Aphelenchoides avenae]|nr:hypothetical protein AAVH_22836 [Aphelenchus avenae]